MLPDSQTAPAIRQVKRSQASDEVTEQLIALITSGQLAEGERLPSEHSLAASFGVSRPVIREALRGLRSLGLVVSKPGSGSFVASSSTGSRPLLLGYYPALELQEVRTLLEVPGAALAAERATDEQLEGLQDLVRQMVDREERRAFAELDAAFHIALAECTANAVHIRLVGDLHELIVENSDVALAADATSQARANREHQRIVDAVVARDPEAAQAAMFEHLDRVTRLMRLAFDGPGER